MMMPADLVGFLANMDAISEHVSLSSPPVNLPNLV